VAGAVFKTVVGREERPGVFDSHTAPPSHEFGGRSKRPPVESATMVGTRRRRQITAAPRISPAWPAPTVEVTRLIVALAIFNSVLMVTGQTLWKLGASARTSTVWSSSSACS